MKAVIFDMDGVIVESEGLKEIAWDKMLKFYGIEGGGDFYRKRAGIPRRFLCSEIIREKDIQASVEDMIEKKQEIYMKLANKKLRAVPGVIDFLKSIPRSKFKLGVASSNYKDVIEKQLKQVGVLELFDEITSGVEEVDEDKPSPEIYLLTARKLEVEPDECVAIEDTEAGVESAKRAGMKCVGYQNPKTREQNLEKADIVIDNFSELDVS